MPAGGDLGFSYLVLVVVSVVSVIGFVLRRKWRRSVARSEEIKRLLVLASEEAARAELEASISYASASISYATTSISYASTGYDTLPETVSRPVQYQCAVCFSPTTTRCARCKAARYCSGKCQIIHWRQGHKEECRPFSTSFRSNDAEGGSSQKVSRQEEYEIHGNSFETEGRQSAKSVQNFPKKPACSKSGYSAEVFCGNDGNGIEGIADGKAPKTTSLDSERSNVHGSINVGQNGPPTPKRTILVDSAELLTSSSNNLNQIRSDHTNHKTESASPSSSGWSIDGSNYSSVSEPSTPSSGVLEGIIDSKPGIDALDDSAQSRSSYTGDMHSPQSTPKISYSKRNVDSLVVVQGSASKTVIRDDAHLTTLGKNKPILRAVLLEEISEDASNGSRSPLLSPYKSDCIAGNSSSDSPASKSREPRYCSSSVAQPTLIAGGPSKVNKLQSLGREKSNPAVNQTNPIAQSSVSKEGGSLPSSASDARLSSSARRPSLQRANPREVDSAQATATVTGSVSNSPTASNGLKTSMLKAVDRLRASKPSRHCQSGVGSEITGRYNNKGLFSYELFVKLYNWNKIELQPRGLINCGNSCYANAVLQCMVYTPPLTAYLLQGLHSKSCERKEQCFTCELESLIQKAKEGTSPLSPVGILSQIQNHGSHLGNGREEDAHEFLRCAIDTMQSICLKEARVNASSSLEEETTLVGLTFGGYLRSKIKCIKCGGKSEQHERMMDLTVEIEGDIGTLEEALRKFTGTEILDGENKYMCSRCRSYQRAKKKLTVLEAPNILTVVLKRFQSGKFGKINKPIQFPEILDLAPYMSGTSDKSPIYRLYGVVIHLDSMNATFSGHYVCYVKNFQNKWFKIDDSMVNAVELGSVLTKKAYMLLYARCSPRAPRVMRNSMMQHDPWKPKNPLIKSRSTSQWDASSAGLLNGHARIECLYPNGKIVEEDSSSDNSSSIFSEGCSCSTESSNRDSSIADDYFDQFFNDPGRNWYSSSKNSSPDSDSSSTSSSSSPSPLYSRHSPMADSDHYSSGYPETSGFRNAESDMDGNGFWTRLPSSRSSDREDKASVPFLYSDTTEHCRKLASSSRRETDSDRLGSANPSHKKSGVTSSSRSTRERTY